MNTTLSLDWRSQADSLVIDGRAFVDGRRVAAGGQPPRPTVSPVDGRFLAELTACGSADVDVAVAAARRAFPAWSRVGAEARKGVLLALAALMERHADELALLETLDSGKPILQTTTVDVPGAISTLRWYAEAADKQAGELPAVPPGATALVTREPLGVVAAIVPWNFPLEIAVWKLAPALAAGNTLVLKPAEQTSLSVLRLAELAAEAGLPDGVLNVVTGSGREVGAALAHHMDVDALAFTGSTAVSRTLLEASGRSNLKRLSLEAGGKSSNIVFADTEDLAAAAAKAAFGAYYNQGQVCSANSRILVQREVHDEFAALLATAAAGYAPEDPLAGLGGNGALISSTHADDVERWIVRGRADGEVLFGGERREIRGSDAYLEPTLLGGLPADHDVHREEIFGPVAVLQPFDTEAEAVRLANATDYGLAASVWTSNLSRAHRVAGELLAGTVSVNTVDALGNTTPFGGFKQSGFGRDLSLHAFDNYTAPKTTWIQFG
ncbi:aldehyde dehydrogenase family protein [Arthrobacter cupressi]|uniref:Aldehyde dehydrogenase (NAD+)/gamma-glutamyl-gamma-aminobutyraldehyde dehydrogenase n=1 Tax=Arthrobacter cupressi TaxID=1045773 RepID=A0A1G8NA11_9MICC|nr:aldehyde dehydrogenase family protein [Arthrobacter cupressi]NYD78298.1 aldehyde dehydrogenase (NAD+)/gamma-glutamyl-gamma-aminobutyraldehyde dehydrogenase [Arthrobacter cupressi]SDI77139.1 aldehyde dehydrogenase (NAD+)/gamma-glutamyl-gamma-aminobutyraldehyde dehydrogenase [Arthrobacter cupressi]